MSIYAKRIQLTDDIGTKLYPKTVSDIVMVPNKSSGVLSDIPLTDKLNEIDLNLKLDVIKRVPNNGYRASYIITQNDVQIGESIDIPQDHYIEGATIQTCTMDDVPVPGYRVGDKYIDFIVGTNKEYEHHKHIYLLITNLVNDYIGGKGINITDNHVVSIDFEDKEVIVDELTEGVATSDKLVTAKGIFSKVREVWNTLNPLKEKVDNMSGEVEDIEEDIVEIKGDINNIEADVTDIVKNKIGTNKGDINQPVYVNENGEIVPIEVPIKYKDEDGHPMYLKNNKIFASELPSPLYETME